MTRGQSFPYDAFISYDHDDRAVAHGIQRGLQRIGRRFGQPPALRVFRDSTDLTASPDLWGKVTEALDRSRYLVVVQSPSAVASKWVNREVAHWLERRGSDHVLFVVASGCLVWDEAAGRFDPGSSDAALPVLTQPGALPAEPLYVDVSDDAPGIRTRRCSGRRSPTWPPRSTANRNPNWRAKTCANNAAFRGYAAPR